MNTIDELIARGVTRIQHDAWNDGQYLRLTILTSESGAKRAAPNAMQYETGKSAEQVPLYTLAGSGEEVWRPYLGTKNKLDIE